MTSPRSSLTSDSDPALLRRFLDRRDEDAFAELVRRHGPVVRAACRRALGESPDADDAFQAVFMILVRKVKTLRNAQLLAPWLHTVAVRAANRVRLLASRRWARERTVETMPEVAAEPQEPKDWLPLLDAEIQRLPQRLRVPLILCELEGKSRAEAAGLLGLNEGTLSSRLARARERLRQRLSQSGMAVTGAGLTAAFLYSSEAMSAEAVTAITSAALSGATSASVAALTQGVLQTMFYAKLKIGLIVFLTLGIGSGALLGARYLAVHADEAKAEDAKSVKGKLEGSWKITSGQLAGKELEGDEGDRIKMQKWVFRGDKVTAKSECAYSIDPSKKPKEMDVTVTEGPEMERGTWKGIYELKGDELTLCFAMPNRDRPTEFASKEGELIMLMKLKREK
jgi:RNA polymerase sigma factor (sigma-70 family)